MRSKIEMRVGLCLIGMLVLSGLAGCKKSTVPLVTPTATLDWIVVAQTIVTPTAVPLPLPPAAATAVPLPSPVPNAPTVKLFFIALEDQGKTGQLIGCGDSAVPVVVSIAPTQGVLRATLEQLLASKAAFYNPGGLYNALYQSDLKIERLVIENQKALIYLTGTVLLNGACDAPRVEAQLTALALQFATVKDVAIYLNNVPLAQALSAKGE